MRSAVRVVARALASAIGAIEAEDDDHGATEPADGDEGEMVQ